MMTTGKDQQIKELEDQCEKLALCLGTFISWSVRELGNDNTIKLLDMLPPPKPPPESNDAGE